MAKSTPQTRTIRAIKAHDRVARAWDVLHRARQEFAQAWEAASDEERTAMLAAVGYTQEGGYGTTCDSDPWEITGNMGA